MKATALLIILITSSSLFGQIEKGTFFLTGNVSYSYSENTYLDSVVFPGNESRFTFAPTVGYFLHDKWAIGAGVQMNFAQNQGLSSTIPTVLGRYYPIKRESFLLFFEANSHFQSRSNTFLNWRASLGVGASLFITPKISFDAHVSLAAYNYTRFGVPESSIISKNFGLNAGAFQADRLRLGFTYYF
jgi:hypothetical protein